MALYSLVYLPAARQDMVEIVRYISRELKNPAAANHVAAELIEAVNRLPEFPYAYPAYIPIRTLKNEYRKLLVANYLIFYCVDDCEKVITVARVIYAKRNYHLLLD